MIMKGEHATLARDFKTCTDLTDKDDIYQVCAQKELFCLVECCKNKT